VDIFNSPGLELFVARVLCNGFPFFAIAPNCCLKMYFLKSECFCATVVNKFTAEFFTASILEAGIDASAKLGTLMFLRVSCM